MSTRPTPTAKTERLLNLVMCLLYTRTPLTKARLRDIVPQYRSAESTEAFDRMFERDKDELRMLGVPLVTEEINGVWEDDIGYVIYHRDYALPEIEFSAAEYAALGLAARAWAQGSLAGTAASALRKLEAGAEARDAETLVGIEPRLAQPDAQFDAVRRAATARVPIAFDYRRADGAVARRHVQPWGMALWRGRWYVTGFDVDRQDERVFRLSRMCSTVDVDGTAGSYEVPTDHSPRASVARSQSTSSPATARVRVREGRGHALRRRATAISADLPGWDQLTLSSDDIDSLASELAGYGADAVAQQPPDLVSAVVTLLRGATGEKQ